MDKDAFPLKTSYLNKSIFCAICCKYFNKVISLWQLIKILEYTVSFKCIYYVPHFDLATC